MISPRGNAHTHASPHAERELRERARYLWSVSSQQTGWRLTRRRIVS
jgi:hypothetical protein